MLLRYPSSCLCTNPHWEQRRNSWKQWPGSSTCTKVRTVRVYSRHHHNQWFVCYNYHFDGGHTHVLKQSFPSSNVLANTNYMLCTAQESEYKYEIERTNRELQEMKRKYYQLRRREEAEDDEGDDVQAGELVYEFYRIDMKRSAELVRILFFPFISISFPSLSSLSLPLTTLSLIFFFSLHFFVTHPSLHWVSERACINWKHWRW